MDPRNHIYFILNQESNYSKLKRQFYSSIISICLFNPLRSWCNIYHRQKWTWWSEFKSHIKLLEFPIVVISSGKLWIQLPSKSWIDTRLFNPCMAIFLAERKLWICCTSFKNWYCAAFCSWKRGTFYQTVTEFRAGLISAENIAWHLLLASLDLYKILRSF